MPPERRRPVRPEDVLNPQEYDLFERARQGELPCPRCGTSFEPLFFFEVLPDGRQSKGVTLRCPGCRFEES